MIMADEVQDTMHEQPSDGVIETATPLGRLGQLAPLAHARAVADEEAGALARRQHPLVLLQRVDDRLELHAAEHAAREGLVIALGLGLG